MWRSSKGSPPGPAARAPAAESRRSRGGGRRRRTSGRSRQARVAAASRGHSWNRGLTPRARPHSPGAAAGGDCAWMPGSRSRYCSEAVPRCECGRRSRIGTGGVRHALMRNIVRSTRWTMPGIVTTTRRSSAASGTEREHRGGPRRCRSGSVGAGAGADGTARRGLLPAVPRAAPTPGFPRMFHAPPWRRARGRGRGRSARRGCLDVAEVRTRRSIGGRGPAGP